MMRWIPWLLVTLLAGLVVWGILSPVIPPDVTQKDEAIRGLSREVQRQVEIKESAMRRVESLERESRKLHDSRALEPPVRSLQEARDALARQLRAQ